VLVVTAPILDDAKKVVIGTVTILLRRDTIFHAIAESTIGATGHAMLFSSDGVPVICPVLSPEEHTVKPELIRALDGLKAGWTVVADDSHGSHNALIGFAPVRFSESLAAGSLGGHQWITVVRQDPQETYAPLAELVAKVLLYGVLVLAVLWLLDRVEAYARRRMRIEPHLVVRECGARELEPRARRQMHVFVPRVLGYENDEPLRLELLLRRACERSVTHVRRVERAAEQDRHAITSTRAPPRRPRPRRRRARLRPSARLRGRRATAVAP